MRDKDESRGQGDITSDRNTSADKDFVSDIGRNLKKQANEKPQLKKKRTLHIYDFKKFKYMREDDVKKRYTFGRKLG